MSIPSFNLRTRKYDRTMAYLPLAMLGTFLMHLLPKCMRASFTSPLAVCCVLGVGLLILLPLTLHLAVLMCNASIKIYLKENTLFCEQDDQLTAIPLEKISDVLKLSEGLLVLGDGKGIKIPSRLLPQEVAKALQKSADPQRRLQLNADQVRDLIEQRRQNKRLWEPRERRLLRAWLLWPVCSYLVSVVIQTFFKLPLQSGWYIWLGLTLCGGTLLARALPSLLDAVAGNSNSQKLETLLLLAQIADDKVIRDYLGWLIECLYQGGGFSSLIATRLLKRIFPTITPEDYHRLTVAQKRRMLFYCEDRELWISFVKCTLRLGTARDIRQLLDVLRRRSWNLKLFSHIGWEAIEHMNRQAKQLLVKREKWEPEDLLRASETPGIQDTEELLRVPTEGKAEGEQLLRPSQVKGEEE
ncbi:MAG TPA: hypothetical protein VKV18_08800 [Chthonomonas sp.]|uniref:hypothetical protein n=1 Tax=Chthonomonas sp. TaxID=2282153 RepID=UPI002B4B5DA8|nr:hypothetical protein [Chthonomonas sp.]HLI48770.1 hypothetical protein [Chthonomonas sp.]